MKRDESSLSPSQEFTSWVSFLASKTSDTTRTTNACESFHSHFKQLFSSPHPNIFVFVDALQAFQTDIYGKVRSVELGHTHTPAAQTIRKSQWIEALIKKNLQNRISTYDYMTKVSAKFGGLFDDH